jgi:hypothetical protein
MQLLIAHTVIAAPRSRITGSKKLHISGDAQAIYSALALAAGQRGAIWLVA